MTLVIFDTKKVSCKIFVWTTGEPLQIIQVRFQIAHQYRVTCFVVQYSARYKMVCLHSFNNPFLLHLRGKYLKQKLFIVRFSTKWCIHVTTGDDMRLWHWTSAAHYILLTVYKNSGYTKTDHMKIDHTKIDHRKLTKRRFSCGQFSGHQKLVLLSYRWDHDAVTGGAETFAMFLSIPKQTSSPKTSLASFFFSPHFL